MIGEWHAASTEFPTLARRYSPAEQQACEALLDDHLDRLETYLRHASGPRADIEKILARAMPLIADLSAHALDLQHPYVASLLRDGFSDIGVNLALRARRLDPGVSMADILQACRNAWTACALQLVLGRPLALTPAIFAYSMLYPYSDNFLDDPRIGRRAKLASSERFRDRLAGGSLTPTHRTEATIWELVSMIESEYPREAYKCVFDSLLAIHSAQQTSISQLAPTYDEHPLDVLRLTFTKGGASVLADAYLATGALTPAECKAAFHWGVLLQLGDDLQDLVDDRARGSRTLFTRAASEDASLDAITNRVFHFGRRVSSHMGAIAKSPGILLELLSKSAQSLLTRSAVYAGDLYSSGYLAQLETYSPFRFAFLRTRERRFARRSTSCLKLFEHFLNERIISTNGGSPRSVFAGSSSTSAAHSR